MLSTTFLIDRVRTSLYQRVPSSETVSSRSDVKHSAYTKFSDDDIKERISMAEYTIMNLCDACNFPSRVQLYGGALPRLDNTFLRILNRVTRDGVRATQRPVQTHRQTDNSLRSATATYPAYTIGENYLRVYPSGGTVQVYVLNGPAVPLGANLSVLEQFEEAVVQHVCGSCRTTMMEEGFDSEVLHGLTQWHQQQFLSEITPYLRSAKLTSYSDQEVTVEKHTA